MRIFPIAQFDADVPDDGITNDEGDSIFDAGRGVAEMVASMLTGLGCQVDPPDLHLDHGWILELETQGRRVWMQITQLPGSPSDGPADVILMTAEKPTLFQWLFRRKDTTYKELLSGLNQALQAEPRFTNIRWYADSDLRDPAASEPLGPDHRRR